MKREDTEVKVEKKDFATDLFEELKDQFLPKEAYFTQELLPDYLQAKKVQKKSKYRDMVYLTNDVMRFSNKGYEGFLDVLEWLILNGWGLDLFIIGLRRVGKSNVMIRIAKDLSKRLGKKFTYEKNLFVADSIIFDVFWLTEQGFGNNEIIVVDEGGKSKGTGKSAGLSGLKQASREFFMVKAGFDMPFITSCPDESDLDAGIVEKDMMFRVTAVRRNHEEGWVEIDIEWNSRSRDLRKLNWLDFAKEVRVDYIPKEEYDEYEIIKRKKIQTAESFDNMKDKFEKKKKEALANMYEKKLKNLMKKIKDLIEEVDINKKDSIEEQIQKGLVLMREFNKDDQITLTQQVTFNDIYNWFQSQLGKETLGQRYFSRIKADWELQQV